MAEFQDVIKHWGRMLDAHRHGESIAIEASVPADAFKDAKLVEEIVMAWAAEHPMPVYPTWEQAIAEIYLRSGRTKYRSITEWEINEHIPADIAQKLGIEPKEDV